MRSFGRFWLMLLSFGISIVLWVYVQVLENPDSGDQSVMPVPIVARNLPDGFTILEKPQFLRVIPDGEDVQRLKQNPDDVVAELDLSKAHAGVDTYPIRVKTLRSYNVTFDPKMATAQVNLDVVLQNVRKPVTIQPIHQLRDPTREYVPANTTSDPSFVYVSGPKSMIDKVKSAQALLDLSTVANGGTATADVELVDANGNQVTNRELSFEPKQVQIAPALAIASESREMLIQPVFKGQPAFGYRVKRVDVTPNQIEIRGRTDALNRVSSIPTETIDITGIAHTTGYTVKPVIPGQLAVSGSPTINIMVVLEPVPTPSPPKINNSKTPGGQ